MAAAEALDGMNRTLRLVYKMRCQVELNPHIRDAVRCDLCGRLYGHLSEEKEIRSR